MELTREDVIQALSDAVEVLPEGKARSELKKLRLGITYKMFGPFGTLPLPSFGPNYCAEQPLPPYEKKMLTPAEELIEGYVPPKGTEIRTDRKLKSVVTYLEHVHGCPKVIE